MGKFFVLMKKGVDQSEFEKFLSCLSTIDTNFRRLKRHYTVEATASQIDEITKDERVQKVQSINTELQLDIENIDNISSLSTDEDLEDKPLWHLDRINKRKAYLNGDNSLKGSGADVDVYILDTGVERTHQEFGSRVVPFFTAFPGNHEDDNGHGTHVAGICAGVNTGVATESKIFSLKVLNARGSGGLYGIVQAIEKVIEHHQDKIATGISRPSVVNMSLGCQKDAFVDNAVNDMLEEGIVVCMAAGNSNWNLDKYDVSPGEVLNGITVCATKWETSFWDRIHMGKDALCSFTNYGSQMDICAPGEEIWSSFPGGKYTGLSGTSMATPLVAGVCASMLEGRMIFKNLDDVLAFNDELINNSTKDILEGDKMSNTPNRMLFLERDDEEKRPFFWFIPKGPRKFLFGMSCFAAFVGLSIWISQFAQ